MWSHLDNDTARTGDPLIFTPSVISRVLPIANYYQTSALKQRIISTVLGILKNCEDSEVTETRFIAAADVLFAVEANLPETEIPDWQPATLRQIFRLMIQISVSHEGSGYYVLNRQLKSTATISYNPNHGLNDLSKKTLSKCLESLSMKIMLTLPTFAESREKKVEALTWPKVSSTADSDSRDSR